MIKKIAVIAVIVAVLWAGAAYFNSGGRATGNGSNQEASIEELPRVSFKAPSFSLQSLSGQTFSIEEAKGKPLMINFWNSWCGPCKEETPELVRLYKKYKGQFQLYGVNITANDSLGAVKLFVQDYNMNYPVLLDKTGEVSDMYNVQGIPTSYFINEDGIIVDKAVGYPGSDVIIKKVKDLISD